MARKRVLLDVGSTEPWYFAYPRSTMGARVEDWALQVIANMHDAPRKHEMTDFIDMGGVTEVLAASILDSDYICIRS